MLDKDFEFERNRGEAAYLGQTGTIYLGLGIWVREGPESESSVNNDCRRWRTAWNLTHRVIV
jgi:hypothetical protein